MSEHTKKHLVTAALPYANGPLHIGHIAGAYLPADIYVRYLKSIGDDVAFICGSDEHGAAITLRAKKEGTTPQAIVDKYHEINKNAFADFGIQFDKYSRTTQEIHKKTAQDFFKVLNDKGVFEKQTSEQFYDEENQQFLADRYIMGECPNCHYENAYGDQCEKCGSTMNPLDLINPKSTISGNTPVLKVTSHWYLPMQKDEDWLRAWVGNGILDGKVHHDPKLWRNQVIGQCKSWIDGGLQPRAMTRDLDWGVKVPVEGADGKVLYVWLDAPIGYISATKEWAEENGKNWEDYWKSHSSELIHFIGKDNIVFHAIIFPIILKAHGDFVLPTNVPANEFLNLEGDKISTSRNWAVWLHEYLEDFPNRQDELRYVLTSIAPESKDSEFTWKDYQARVNNELVAILGNFVNRVAVLTHKYYEGEIPAADFSEEENEVLKQAKKLAVKSGDLIKQFKFREAQNTAMGIARIGNKYLADVEPWKLIKTNPEKVKVIMTLAIELVSVLEETFRPFLPETSNRLNSFLNDRKTLAKPELLFQKIEDKDIDAQTEKLANSKKMNEPKPLKAPQLPAINFGDFTKMDIRVGTILEAKKVPKANKLLKLLVDTGLDQRTVVSGIAEHYSAEEVIGKKVSVLLNLEPRTICGVESQGMILMAENTNGELSFLSPEKDVESGSEIS